MKVMIGVDPDKGSHTATMLDRHGHEVPLLTMRAGSWQVSLGLQQPPVSVSSKMASDLDQMCVVPQCGHFTEFPVSTDR
jgi:hypothetical protein